MVYEGKHNHFPLAAIYGKDGKPLLSWRVAILPQLLEGRTLYDQFHLDEPWDSSHNKPLLSKMPSAYAIPGIGEPMTTCYQVFVGEDTLFETRMAKAPDGQVLASHLWRLAVTIPDVVDGTSNTLLVVEARKAVPWTKPEDLPYAKDAHVPELGGPFRDVIHAAIADGSVRCLDRNAPNHLLRRGITRNDRLYFDLNFIGYPAPMGGLGSKERNEETRRQVEKARLDGADLQQQFIEQVQKEGLLTKEDAMKIELNMEADKLFKELRLLTEEADYLRQHIKGMKVQPPKAPKP